MLFSELYANKMADCPCDPFKRYPTDSMSIMLNMHDR